MKKTAKKTFNRLTAIFLAAIMVLGAAPVGALEGLELKLPGWLKSPFGVEAEAASYAPEDIIEFGSYPQSRVTDAGVISALNAKPKTWVSYGYYSGTGSWDDGEMTPKDFMKYADVSNGAAKYRAVSFTQYRPSWTGDTLSASNSYSSSYQDDNGYYVNTTYWFRYEPLRWRVLDPAAGLVLCETIIDSQAYSNTVYNNGSGSGYYQDTSCTTYANDYAESSLREWLNDDFYNTAFTGTEKGQITALNRENKSYYSSAYDSANTTDKVTLLTAWDMMNSSYGFSTSYSYLDTARWAQGSDYAKCQGLEANNSQGSSYYGNSTYWLRTPGNFSLYACYVSYDGYVYTGGDYVSYDFVGVRPALNLNLNSGIFESGNLSDIDKLSGSEYGIYVVNSDGDVIPGAAVSWNGTQKKTNENGLAIFPKITISEPEIEVTKDGYIPYSNKNTNYSKSTDGYDVIIMYKTGSEEAYKLAKALYINWILPQDVLIKTKRLNLANATSWFGNDAFNLLCKANVENGIDRYELWQGKKRIAVSTDGAFSNLKLTSFAEGGGVKVRVYTSSTKYVATPLNLKFEDDKAVEETSITLGEKIKIAVRDDIPYLGGSTFEVDFPALPVEIYVDDDGDGGGKAHVGINATIYQGEKEPDSSWTKEEKKAWKDEIAESCKKIKDSMKTLNDYKSGVKKYLSSGDKSKLDNVMKKQKKSNLPGLDSVDISFIGYGEGAWNSNGLSTISINLYMVADLKGISMTQQFAVWIVPFVITIDVGCEIKSSVVGKYDFQKQTISADWTANIKPYLNAFGGVGIGKAVGVGAYGDADLDVEIQILGTTTSTGVNKVDLTGDLGVKAYFAIFEFKKSFAHNTWRLYTRTQKSPAPVQPNAAEPTLQEELYNPESYALQDTAYLQDESPWLAGVPNEFSLMSVGGDEAVNIKPMLTQTYRNPQPAVASSGNATVMAYIGADTSRDAYNFTRAMYSVYNREQETWSEPLQLDSNATADSSVCLYSDGSDIYMAYLDAARAFTASDTMEAFAGAQNIAVAKFNNATGKFGSPVTVAAAEGKNISSPCIAKVRNALTVMWQSNTTSNPFGVGSENSVCYSMLENSTWSEAKTLKSGLNTITGMAIEKNAAAYVTDADNDLATVNDRTVTYTDMQDSFVELDAGTVANPAFSSDGKLYWYSNGSLKQYDGDAALNLYPDGIGGFTEKFAVLNNKVLYLSATDAGSDIFVLTYDGAANKWNQPVQLSEQDKTIDFISATLCNGVPLTVMSRRDVTINEDNVDDECELSYAFISEKHDIGVQCAEYNSNEVVSGADLPLTVEIANNGSTRVENVKVAVENSADIEMCSQTVAVGINPGESKSVAVNLPMATEIELDEYTVSVAEEGVTDANIGDNTVDVKIGYCKFDVSAQPIVIGGKHYVMINVTNNSHVKSGGVLNVYNAENEAAPLKSIDIEELENGQTNMFSLSVDEALLGGEKNVITFEAVSSKEQDDLYCNREQVYCDIKDYDITEPCTVTWIVNGVESKQTYGEGEAIIKPADPVKPGYTFTGWSPEVPDTMPANDLTFTATFTPIEYNAVFLAEGVNVGTIPYTVETVSITPPPVPAKTGCSGVWEPYALSVGGITVNAVYTPNIYKIRWIIDGNETTSSVAFGTAITKPAAPVKPGCTFTGWSPEVPDTMPANDLTFTAVFARNRVTKVEIASAPSKRDYTYKLDGSLDLSGLALRVAYADGSTESVTDTAKMTVSGYDPGKTGSQTIKVEYEGCTATFNVNVKLVWWQWLIKIILFGWIWY